MRTYKIYGLKLKEDNNIRYIGYTGKTIEERLMKHFTETVRHNHKNANWIKKHKHEIEIVLIEDGISTIEEAWNKEIEYIKMYHNLGYNLTNTSEGGKGAGCAENNPFYGKKHSEETKEVMSSKAKQHIGENNNFYGKKHTDETKKKISESRIGKYIGENNSFYGKLHSEESRKKMSISGAKKDMSRFNKKVSQIDKITNEVIKIWDSIAEAAQEIIGDKTSGTRISAACKGKIKTAGGYIWKYID